VRGPVLPEGGIKGKSEYNVTNPQHETRTDHEGGRSGGSPRWRIKKGGVKGGHWTGTGEKPKFPASLTPESDAVGPKKKKGFQETKQ